MAENTPEYKKFILELIEAYRSLTALWDINNNDYNDRILKEQQYDILLKKFHEKHPEADKKQLKKKLNSLRTNYRRELKRIKDNEKIGSKIEEPTLYYFEALNKFLKDIETPAKNTMKTDDPETSKSNKKSKLAHSTNPSSDAEEPEVKKKKTCNAIDDLVKLATQRLKVPKTYSQLLASVWADKLSRMERTQRIVAEKLINEIIFNGELSLLNINTSLTNISTSPADLNHTSTSGYSHEENYIIRSGSPIMEEEIKVEIDANGDDIYGM